MRQCSADARIAHLLLYITVSLILRLSLRGVEYDRVQMRQHCGAGSRSIAWGEGAGGVSLTPSDARVLLALSSVSRSSRAPEGRRVTLDRRFRQLSNTSCPAFVTCDDSFAFPSLATMAPRARLSLAISTARPSSQSLAPCLALVYSPIRPPVCPYTCLPVHSSAALAPARPRQRYCSRRRRSTRQRRSYSYAACMTSGKCFLHSFRSHLASSRRQLLRAQIPAPLIVCRSLE